MSQDALPPTVRPATTLWRHQDFLKLWAGQTISVYGSLVTRVALPWLAIGLGARPPQLAVMAAAELVPGFVVGLAAGAWVDRLAKRPILIACDLARAGLLCIVPLAAWQGWLSIPLLYVVQALSSVFTVFFDVAYEAYLPELVTREQLVEGNSKLTAAASAAEFASFGSAGWLVQRFTAPVAIAVDAVSYLVSAASVAAIGRREESDAVHADLRSHLGEPHAYLLSPATAPALDQGLDADEPPIVRTGQAAKAGHWLVAGIAHFAADVRDGVHFVVTSPVLRSLMFAQMLLMFGFRLGGTVWMLFVTKELGVPVSTQGMIYALGGLTSLAGASVAGRVTARWGLGRTMVAALVVAALGQILIPLAPNASWIGIALMIGQQFLTDPSVTIFEIDLVSLRQARTPAPLRGRMNATMRVLTFAAMLTGAGLSGVLGEAFGLRPTLAGGALAVFMAGLWLAASPVRPVIAVEPEAETPVAPDSV